jgi:peptide deformylase
MLIWRAIPAGAGLGQTRMSRIVRPDLDDLAILCYPDKRLRQRAAALEQLDAFLGEVAERMRQLMTEQGGIGLAATQVGWPFRFAVVQPPNQEGKTLALVNPTIVERDGRMTVDEGCLSVPGIRANVGRAEFVRVRALDLKGEPMEFEGEGLMAQLIQHEVDHLEGRLFVDLVGPASRVILKRQLRDLSRRQRGKD